MPRCRNNRHVAPAGTRKPAGTGSVTHSGSSKRSADIVSGRDAGLCFAHVFAEGPLGIAVVRQSGELIAANPALCRMLGYKKTALLKCSLADLVEPSERQVTGTDVDTLLGVSALPANVEVRLRAKDGTDVAGRLTIVRGDTECDTMASRLVMVEDITAQKDAERARTRAQQTTRERERFLEAIVENIPDMIFVKDAKTLQFIRFNRAGEELLGYTREELVGKTDHNFYPAAQADFFHQIDREVLASGKLHDVAEERIATRSRGERLLHTKKIPIVDAHGHPQYLLGISEDVTDQKRLQARIAQADRMASIGLLAAGVAHEINNPLTYVLYNLRSLGDALPAVAQTLEQWRPILQQRLADGMSPTQAPTLDPCLDRTYLDEVIDKVESAVEGAQRVKQIVQDLKTFSRTEDDQLAPLSINAVIDGAINMAFNEIKYRARLVKEYNDIPPLLGNDGRLAQVFLNLLVNAAHAIEEGPADRNEICVRTYVDGDEVVAAVSDTGTGIAPEVLEHLFEPFSTTRREGSGFGLGLSICRNLVTTLGGRIDVSSEVGKGSCFTVRLPLTRATAAEAPPARRTAPRSPLRQARQRVLVIDDEPCVVTAISQMLSHHAEVATAHSGSEAKAILCRDTHFDAIVCDLMMPTTTGMDLHQWLLGQRSELAKRMVFISGGAFTPRAKEFISRVPNAFLEKPFEPEALLAKMREVVDTRPPTYAA